ncbi:hypothetical protein SAMN05518672_101790 [Chitinophaga sp. CF118]|nr:hypothetical protein SAMN05518672_101790 [Chitinophaga sp. CF118]
MKIMMVTHLANAGFHDGIMRIDADDIQIMK